MTPDEKITNEKINKAIEIDPKSAGNYLSHGIGNYYLPAALGGGVELAIQDFQKAISLDAKSSDAQLWLGLALRQLNKVIKAGGSRKNSKNTPAKLRKLSEAWER